MLMSKEENKLVPKLRFPEFKDDEGWTKMSLYNLAKETTEKAGGNSFKLMSITSGVGLVSQLEKFGREIAGNSYKNYYVIKKGDFAYNKSSTKLYPEGEIAVLEKEVNGAVPSSIFTCFRFNPNYVLSGFAKYLFINNVHGKWLRQFISLGARANGALQVNTKDLFALPIVFPSLIEQQKIADCLSSLDDLIIAQNQKLEALKAHKKGLMQQLFPAEDETVPKRRFEEFRDSGEWEEKKLDDIGKFIGGGTPDTSKPEYWDGTIQWFTPSEIKERNASKSIRTITEKGLQNSSAKLLPKGALLITTRATIGEISIAVKECTTNQGFQSLIVDNSESNVFWYYWIIQNKSELKLKASGSTFPEIGKTEILKIKVLHPEKIEQQKIADCLSSLDKLITEQAQKIEALKQHKKGLLQGLFPSPERT